MLDTEIKKEKTIFDFKLTERPNGKKEKIKIYTAGKMPCSFENISNTWRGKLEKGILNNNIQFLHPVLEGCDHSGIMPDATVDNDLNLINESDLVIGYFDQPELYGTITEILYAASIGKKIGLVFHKQNLSNRYDWRETHACYCCWDSIGVGIQAHEYWFMERLFVQYLLFTKAVYDESLVFYVDDIDYKNIIYSEHDVEIKYLNSDAIINKIISAINKIYQ